MTTAAGGDCKEQLAGTAARSPAEHPGLEVVEMGQGWHCCKLSCFLTSPPHKIRDV